YFAAVFGAFEGFDGELVFEPGLWLMAEAGILLARVVRVKRGDTRRFLVLDAAMNDLIRPSLYEAWHDIVPLVPANRPLREYDVVGPVCETGDTFAQGRVLPEVEADELVAICGAGAYGMSMASTYNSRQLPAEVLLERGGYYLIRRRQSWEEMTAGESLLQERRTT
ncbi:MAG: diaminopimelate decarboxylase, partial [Lysobacteraceae bacterium]